MRTLKKSSNKNIANMFDLIFIYLFIYFFYQWMLEITNFILFFK